MSILRLFLDTFSDLLNRLDNVAFFKFGKGPMHMGVVSMSVEFLGLTADVESLFVDHVHVEKEGQVVVGMRVLVVQHYALLQVLNGLRVVTDFKVRYTKVILAPNSNLCNLVLS